jgi:hypothetical protein
VREGMDEGLANNNHVSELGYHSKAWQTVWCLNSIIRETGSGSSFKKGFEAV